MPDGTQVKLLDFGIAKLADEQSAGVKTQTGTPIGTPAYMSPEQCMGRSDLDHRTDLYSLGCILFRMLCGRPPFLSQYGTGVMIAAHMHDAPPDPRTLNPRVPAALGPVVLCLLEKDPSARFQTAIELRNALVAAGANAPVTHVPAVIPGGIVAGRASVIDLEGPMRRSTALPAGQDRSRRAVRRRARAHRGAESASR
jgi:serine/threonine-protein kinase